MTKEYKDWLFVGVPKDATDFSLHELEGIEKLVFSSDIQDPLKCGGDMMRLPSGSYQIIGKGDKVGDTIWYGIVDKQDYRKGNYNDYWFMDYVTNEYSLQDATSSGYSLVRSLGMEPEECLVLKKNEK